MRAGARPSRRGRLKDYGQERRRTSPDRGGRVPRRPLMRQRRAEPKLTKARIPRRERHLMAKRGNKRRARKKKNANHGKRPNA
ncbi:hypothetical protein GCM10010433_19560 [Streptomyces pulveraceus]